MIKWVNLTPHEITLVREGEPPLAIPPSGVVARVSTTRTLVRVVDGIHFHRATYGAVEGLPSSEGDTETIFIVSGMILSALIERGEDRDDVCAPGAQLRDSQGRVIGCLDFNV